MIRAMYREAEKIERADEREAFLRCVMKSEDYRRIDATVKILGFHPSVVVTPDQFDFDPMLLNVANGSVDLTTGTLREHRRTDLCAGSPDNPGK